MILKRQQLGNLGEQLANEYVRSLGWHVIATRFRIQDGEIDLIAQANDVLIFVEVRARTSMEFGNGMESVDERKVLRMSRVAQAYLHQYNWNGSFRMDVIALMLSPQGSLLNLMHVRDITL